MKPNGLVAAASITSHTLMPIRSHMIAISFTRPMLIMRKVFSSSFTISATCVELTGTTCSERLRIEQRAHFGAGRRDAADHFGNVVASGISDCPDRRARARSTGRNLRPPSGPTFSSIGRTSSSVVPGYVVDSRITSLPGLKYFAISSHADTM